jgi:MFS family permease
LGTLLCGPLADRVGWPPVFVLTAGLALGAAILTGFLKEN